MQGTTGLLGMSGTLFLGLVTWFIVVSVLVPLRIGSILKESKEQTRLLREQDAILSELRDLMRSWKLIA